jgi:hypothetical protein
MLFREIFIVYSGNHKKPEIENAELLTAKVGGTYSNHWALES